MRRKCAASAFAGNVCSLNRLLSFCFGVLFTESVLRMVVTKSYSDGKSFSDQEAATGIKPKAEGLDCDMPPQTMSSRNVGDNVATSSGSNIRSSFISMGFSASLVDKVLDEKGEDNADMLLETLFEYSALQNSNSESSDSLEELFSDVKDGSSNVEFEEESHPKKELDVPEECKDDTRVSLLMMNFTVAEVDFAMDKLGKDAAIAELVDFITAAQIARTFENDADVPTNNNGYKNEADNTEALYMTVDKTRQLIEMGFSENEISMAIEKLGFEASITELAEAIFAGQFSDTCADNYKNSVSSRINHLRSRSVAGVGRSLSTKDVLKRHFDKFVVENEAYGLEDASYISMGVKIHKGKRLKQEHMDESSSFHGPAWIEDVKPGIGGLNRFGITQLSKPNPGQNSHDKMVGKSPYFFYGNVANLPQSTWAKISQFLYAIEPEFVNTQLFSALSRKEGYIHNLPTKNRFHILPTGPMTIEDVIPHSKKWWPSWDRRKQINCIISETIGISQLCDRLGRILTDSQGVVSVEQQSDILHHCGKWNLLWVGKHKLAPIEPEHLECILGYPSHHTKAVQFTLTERLWALKHCFQTDTLGYHLSVLKPMFPSGLTVLSLYSGIGGVEVSLLRLGIRLRGVVSVETCKTKRGILQRWWSETRQAGELVQIEDAHKLTSKRLGCLINKFGGFDLVIAQTPSLFKGSKMSANGDSSLGFDFSLFCDFVRILKCVETIMGRADG